MSPRTAKSVKSTKRKSSVRDASGDPRRKEPSKSRTRVTRRPVEPIPQGSGVEGDQTNDPIPSIGENLRKLRTERNLSLDALAKLSGVSRAMLGQIEHKHSVPTITVLWRISQALDLPFSSLLREPEQKGPSILRRVSARYLTSADGTFKSRALFSGDSQRNVEFYEVRLAPGAVENATAHPAGTFENLVVAKGSVEVSSDSMGPAELGTGDALVFRADVPHCYHNSGSGETVLYMVISYAPQS